jgi:hypothetical protein
LPDPPFGGVQRLREARCELEFFVPIAVVCDHDHVSTVLDSQLFDALEHCTDPSVKVFAHAEPDGGIFLSLHRVGRLSDFPVIGLHERVSGVFLTCRRQALATFVHRVV